MTPIATHLLGAASGFLIGFGLRGILEISRNHKVHGYRPLWGRSR